MGTGVLFLPSVYYITLPPPRLYPEEPVLSSPLRTDCYIQSSPPPLHLEYSDRNDVLIVFLLLLYYYQLCAWSLK